jgi:FhaA, N-terminal domain/FHA domain
LVVCPAMSRPFAAVESFLERILERPAARLFHAHPQPEQVERRIERAMSAMKVVAAGHTYVPSRYRILLNPADLEALQASEEDLSAMLADAILVRAREQGRWLLRRPDVALVASPRVSQGDLEVDAEPLDPSLVAAAATGLRPVELEGPRAPRAPIPGTGVIDDEDVAQPTPDAVRGPAAGEPMSGHAAAPRAAIPVVVEAEAPPAVLPVAQAAPPLGAPPDAAVRAEAPAPSHASAPPASLDASSSSASMLPEDGVVGGGSSLPAPVGREPAVPPPLLPPPLVGPLATIEVQLPDGTVREVAFEGDALEVGRGTDNGIVIPDERVSRHHGRFSARHGTLVYTDLGSTNGSQVGGVRVREVALGAGDVVRVGRATLTVRPRT